MVKEKRNKGFNKPTREQVEIELPKALISEIEQFAKKTGVSFDDVLNSALASQLKKSRDFNLFDFTAGFIKPRKIRIIEIEVA